MILKKFVSLLIYQNPGSRDLDRENTLKSWYYEILKVEEDHGKSPPDYGYKGQLS